MSFIPGQDYKIGVPSGEVLTSVTSSGDVKLEPYDSKNSKKWTCSQTHYGYAFRNRHSDKYLGVNENGDICANVSKNPGPHENFIFQTVTGGYQTIILYKGENSVMMQPSNPDGSPADYIHAQSDLARVLAISATTV